MIDLSKQRKLNDGKFFGKPSICANFCPDSELNVQQRLDMILQHGFGATMLGVNKREVALDLDKQAEYCKKIGLRVCCVHLPFDGPEGELSSNKIWTDDQHYFDVIADNLKICGDYGIEVAIFHLTSGGNAPAPNEMGLASIEKLCEIAEKKHVILAFENKRNTNHLNVAFEKIDSPALGYCYDIGHESAFQKNLGMPIELAKKYPAVMIHLHDNGGVWDEHKIPFDGSIDYNLIKKQLIQINYSNDLLLEVRKDISDMYYGMTASQFLTRAYNHAIKFQNMFLTKS